jgi:hypothetical protein
VRQPGAPPACDICGSTDRVGAVVHRQMVAPYVRDTCRTCSRQSALRYYREGGTPIYYRRPAGEAPPPTPGDTAPSSGLDVGPTSREW